MEQTQPSPFSLDALIRLAKKVSLLTALVTGLGLVALYFFGIAIYATFLSAFGVPPFEFSLQHFGAGIAPGDLLVELGGVRLDGSLELSAVAALGMQGKPADLLVSRDGKPLKLRIQPEWAR